MRGGSAVKPSPNAAVSRHDGRRRRVLAASLVILLACLAAAACSGGGSPGVSTPSSTPGPGQGGGDGGPPPPELVAVLKSLPVHPGSKLADATLPDGVATVEGLALTYLIDGVVPDGVMKFYFEEMSVLGWEPEIGPTTTVYEKIADYGTGETVQSVSWRQTLVKGDLRVRLEASPLKEGKDDDTVIGTAVTLTIMRRTLPPFPTPYATGIPSTPLPLPTAIEPVSPVGTGIVITPTLPPGQSMEGGRSTMPIVTPTATPVPVR